MEASFCPFASPLPAVLMSCLHSLLVYCIVLSFTPSLLLRIRGSQNQRAHDLVMFYDALGLLLMFFLAATPCPVRLKVLVTAVQPHPNLEKAW